MRALTFFKARILPFIVGFIQATVWIYSELFKGFVVLFRYVWDLVSNAVANALRAAIAWVSRKVASFVQFIMAVANAVAVWWNAIVTKILDIWSSIVVKIADAWSALRDLALAIWTAIADPISARVSAWFASVRMGLAQAVSFVATKIQSAFAWIAARLAALPQVFGFLQQTVRTLPQRLPWASQFVRLLLNATLIPAYRILKAILWQFPIELVQSLITVSSLITAPVVRLATTLIDKIKPMVASVFSAIARIFSRLTAFRIARLPVVPFAWLYSVLTHTLVTVPLRQFAALWKSIAAKLIASSVTITAPIFSALSRIPQFILGADIIRAIFSKTIGKTILRFFGMAGIGGLILSLILELIPWEDIGQVLHWSRQTVVSLQMSGRFIRILLGAMLLALTGIVKAITVDFIGGLIDIFRMRGFTLVSRWRDTLQTFRQSIEELFYNFMTDWKKEVTRIQQEARFEAVAEALDRLVTFIGDSFKTHTRNFQKLQIELSNFYQTLSGLFTGLGVAPPGIDERVTRIAELATTFNLALADYQSFLDQMQAARNLLDVIYGESAQMQARFSEASELIRKLAMLPEQLWTPEPFAGAGSAVDVMEQLHHLIIREAGLLDQLDNLRKRILQLPEEQQRQLAGTLEWIEDAKRKLIDFGKVLASAMQKPAEAKEDVIRAAEEIISVLGREQFRSAVTDPIANLLSNLQEQFAEFKRRIMELSDPRSIRDFVNSIAQVQFDYLTEGFRQSAEAARTFNEYLRELGLTSRVNERSALDLLSAYQAVMTVLAQPAAKSPAEAFRLMEDAFSRISDESKSVQINFQRLYDLLRRYNFMQITAEAARETHRRLSELAKSILDEFRNLIETFRNAAENFKSALDHLVESASAFYFGINNAVYDSIGLMTLFVDQAIAAERKATRSMLFELYVRSQEMRRLGATEAEIAAELGARWVRFVNSLKFTRTASLQELADLSRSYRAFAESAGNALDEIVLKHREAALYMQLARNAFVAGIRVIERTGSVTSAAVGYFRQYAEALRQAAEASLDYRVALRGLASLWDEIRELLPSGESLVDLAERLSFFPTYLTVALAKIRELASNIGRLALIPSWDAFVKRLQLLSQLRDTVKRIFVMPEEFANFVSRWSETLRTFIEQGFVPNILRMTMPQVRTALIASLNWLRQFYTMELQVLMNLVNLAVPGTRPWLELNERILQTIDNLAKVENQLRDIRSALVSLTLYEVPERISQFLITEGPALWSFMRTGALGGISTINFTIHVSAQDVSVGVQQALQQAQRTLAGFTYRTIF